MASSSSPSKMRRKQVKVAVMVTVTRSPPGMAVQNQGQSVMSCLCSGETREEGGAGARHAVELPLRQQLPVAVGQQPRHIFCVVRCCWGVLSAVVTAFLGWDDGVGRRRRDAVLC